MRALVGIKALQPVEHMLELHARHTCAVRRSRGHMLSRQYDPGEVRERATRADHLRTAPVFHGHGAPESLAHMLAQCTHATRVHFGHQETFGESDGAKGQGGNALNEVILCQDELERAAADVHHDRAAGTELEMGQRTAIAEQRFFLAAQDAHGSSGERFHFPGKVCTVGGIADSAGGDDLDAGRAQLVGEHDHAMHRSHGRINGGGRQRAGCFETLTQPRHRFHLVDHADLTGGRHICHNLADGVGADVDRGDPDVGRCGRDGCRHVESMEEGVGASSSNR